jgi:hypothetical protein
MSYIPVTSVIPELAETFGLVYSEYECKRQASHALKLLNRFAVDHKLTGYVVDDTMRVEACGVAKILSVTRELDFDYSRNGLDLDGTVFPPQIYFTVPVVNKSSALPLTEPEKLAYIPQITGPYVDYKQVGNYIRFNEPRMRVIVETIEIMRDAKGLPLMDEECYEYLKYYLLYINALARFRAEPTAANEKVFLTFERLKNTKFGQAKTEGFFTRNEMDKLADTMVSMDRKSYGYNV